MKKYNLIISISAILFLFFGGRYLINNRNKFSQSTNSLTEPEARKIAEKSCIKGGEALGPGTYNENSKTWWFDANLNATGNVDHSDVEFTAGESRDQISREINTHSDETAFPKTDKDVWPEE